MLSGSAFAELVTDAYRTSIRILHERLVTYDTTKDYGPENAAINAAAEIETVSAPDRVYDRKRRRVADNSTAHTTVSKKANPWSCFMRLKQLKVLAFVIEHMKVHGNDAAPFLAWQGSRSAISDLPYERREKAFSSCYYSITALRANMEADRIVWLFHMLQYYDLC